MNKQEVLKFFGGTTATARQLGITSQAVTRWSEVIPAGRAFQIEVLTNGALRASQSSQSRPSV